MLHKFFHRFIQRRHYWRDVGFDELTELYLGMMFRSLAVSLVGIFIPVYLYQLGFEIWEILYFYTIFFAANAMATLGASFIIAKIGPKHTILLSFIMQSISMIGLISLSDNLFPLWPIAIATGVAGSLFFTAFHVDFSKIKHDDHAGKEVGWVNIMQRVGAVLGPIIGGLVAYFIGSQYIFMVALIMLFIGIIPLMLTSEPIKTRQKLKWDLDIRKARRDLISYSAHTLESAISMIVWPMFVGIIILTDNTYIQLGSVVSLSVIVSMFIAQTIGRSVDKNKGRQLLQFGAISNAILHLFRPFVGGYPTVLATNLVNEGLTLAYTMPYMKGVYAAADEHPGYRIVYICSLEFVGGIARCIFFAASTLAAITWGSGKGLFAGMFIVGAVASLLIMTETFRALKSR